MSSSAWFAGPPWALSHTLTWKFDVEKVSRVLMLLAVEGSDVARWRKKAAKTSAAASKTKQKRESHFVFLWLVNWKKKTLLDVYRNYCGWYGQKYWDTVSWGKKKDKTKFWQTCTKFYCRPFSTIFFTFFTFFGFVQLSKCLSLHTYSWTIFTPFLMLFQSHNLHYFDTFLRRGGRTFNIVAIFHPHFHKCHYWNRHLSFIFTFHLLTRPHMCVCVWRPK